MLVSRVEQHQIKQFHPMYKMIDELCFKSKNVYNYGNYLIRQEFINNNKWIRYADLSKQIKHSDCFMDLGSNSAQMTLRILDKAWKSFFKAIKDWKKNPNKYLGMPKLPKYKDKSGRFTCVLTNMQTHIKDGYLYFAFKELKPFNNLIRTNVNGRLLQTRFIPKNNIYILEVVYEIEVPDEKDENFISKNICSIDLGVNNFITMTNNLGVKPIVINGRVLKSINQYYSKELAKYKSILKKTNNKDWSKRFDRISIKRFNKIKYFMHKASKSVINYCIGLNIDTIVIGNNKKWKQNSHMIKSANQTFVQIPYNMFIDMLTSKAEDIGIKIILTEESYTSGTSFLDNEKPIKENYNKSRRIKRGLFQSNNGTLINSDVNGSLQIMKKVFPDVFNNGIEGVYLHPLIINV